MRIIRDNSIANPFFGQISFGDIFKSGKAYYLAFAPKSDFKYDAVNLETGHFRSFIPTKKFSFAKTRS